MSLKNPWRVGAAIPLDGDLGVVAHADGWFAVVAVNGEYVAVHGHPVDGFASAAREDGATFETLADAIAEIEAIKS